MSEFCCQKTEKVIATWIILMVCVSLHSIVIDMPSKIFMKNSINLS